LCGWDFARSRKGFAARRAPRLQAGGVVCITIERERERVRFSPAENGASRGAAAGCEVAFPYPQHYPQV